MGKPPSGFEHATGRYPVEIIRSDRKRAAITVHPDLRISVRLPSEAADKDAEDLLSRRQTWIFRQLTRFHEFRPITPPRQYISGETHYYLGRQYRLKITEGTPLHVRLKQGYFLVTAPEPGNRKAIQKAVQTWYTEHARALLSRRLALYLPRVQRRGATVPTVRFRRMTHRWGSCSPKGTIMLNTELVKVPITCIDYVLVHELCHLLHPHHDAAFFRLLTILVPDWKTRRERLARAGCASV